MRKLVILSIALVALAIPAAGMAAVWNGNGVGTVAKGDVMNPLQLSETLFQNTVRPTGEQVTFTHKTGTSINYYWTCSDESKQVMTLTIPATQPVFASEIWNASSNKVTGWTLNGFGATTYGTSTMTGASFFSCPDGSERTSGLLSEPPTPIDVLEAHYPGKPAVDLPNIQVAVSA